MTYRLALTLAIAPLAAAPALAQTDPEPNDEPGHGTEIELGASGMLNMGSGDLEGVAGPAIDVTWTRWRGRTGVGFGAMAIFGLHDDFLA